MKPRIAIAIALTVTLGAASFSVLPAAAQSSEQLVRALIARPPTPAMMLAPAYKIAKEQPIVVAPPVATPPPFSAAQLRSMATRNLLGAERKQLAEAVQENHLPSVDMEVYFAYDSAAIGQNAVGSLYTLGQALSDPRLRGQPFLIAGHTDATGGDAYNQVLSERRAWSVKAFLVETFHLDPQSLIAVGYGEEQLKDWYNPASGVNRRVQIVNLAGE